MTRSELHENMMVALDALHAHKVRSSLTVLGIIIGVTSVISVAAIIQGLNGYISKRVEAMGSRTYFVSRFSMGSRFGRLPEKIRKRKYLNLSDADYLRENCPSLSVVTAVTGRPMTGDLGPDESNEIRYASERVEQFVVRAVEPDFSQVIPLASVAQGRFVTRFDVEHSRPVVVLGDAIASSLFPQLDPIGKQVRLNGKLLEVIGVFEKDPGLFGMGGVDQVAAMPLSTFLKYYPQTREIMIAFAINEQAELGKALNEVIEAMRRLRRVPHNDENDFEVLSPDFLSNLWSQLTGALVLLTAVVSSIGLLIGGIGVMNIMLISVTERTAEIGVRKAMGARRSDIRVQFLMEAMTLSLTGGVLGIACGAAIALAVRSAVPNVPAALSYFWMAMGALISVGVGLFFGYYPASRAANLDPVECLRYE